MINGIICKFALTLYLYWLRLNLIFSNFKRKMSEILDYNSISQDSPNQSCLNDEPQESNKNSDSINDASKSYSK